MLLSSRHLVESRSLPGTRSKKNYPFMEEFERPLRLILNGNLKENWKKFKRDFDWYLLAKNLGKATDKRKVAILLTIAGPDARELFTTFHLLKGRTTGMPLSWASLRNSAG